VNMAPADLKKEGSAYDLPLAIGILAASGQILCPDLDKYLIMGELSLDGGVKPIKGVLPIAIEAGRTVTGASSFPVIMPGKLQ